MEKVFRYLILTINIFLKFNIQKGIFGLILIILNFYAYVAYKYYHDRFTKNVRGTDGEFKDEFVCDSPIKCFLALINDGLREDLGIGTFGYNVS